MAGQPYMTASFRDGSQAVLWTPIGLWTVGRTVQFDQANDVRCAAEQFIAWRNPVRRCWIWLPTLWLRLKREPVVEG